MRVEKGTKDHIGARRDLQDLGIRSALHLVGNEIPMASHTLDDYVAQDVKISRWLCVYLARNIDMTKHSILGMRSHDCHVFMQRLIPIAFHELLPVPVWEALTELSSIFF